MKEAFSPNTETPDNKGMWVTFRRIPNYSTILDGDMKNICTWPFSIYAVEDGNGSYGNNDIIVTLDKDTSDFYNYYKTYYNTDKPSDSRPPHPGIDYSGSGHDELLRYKTAGTNDTAFSTTDNWPDFNNSSNFSLNYQAIWNAIYTYSGTKIVDKMQICPLMLPIWRGDRRFFTSEWFEIGQNGNVFNHRYVFKVELPDLHTTNNGGTAGSIDIRFGTGMTISEYRTGNIMNQRAEGGTFANCDMTVKVFNQG